MVRKIILAILLMASISFAESINLQWDQNTETDISHYRVYKFRPLRNSMFTDYTSVIFPQHSITLNNMSSNHKYLYFVTAVNTSGLESTNSNYLKMNVPASVAKCKFSCSIK